MARPEENLPGAVRVTWAGMTCKDGPKLRVNWTQSRDALTYSIFVDEIARASIPAGEGDSGRSALIDAAVFQGTISVFVRAYNAAGFTDADAVSVLVYNPCPASDAEIEQSVEDALPSASECREMWNTLYAAIAGREAFVKSSEDIFHVAETALIKWLEAGNVSGFFRDKVKRAKIRVARNPSGRLPNEGKIRA